MLHNVVKLFDSRSALELGTNVGISASYIAAASCGEAVTLEASPYRARLAQRLFDASGIKNARVVLGMFDDTLEDVLDQIGELDFAFIDGNHHLSPTLNYFEQIVVRMRPGGVIVFDDIRWSRGMRQAWELLRNDDRLSLTVDLSRLGVGIVRSGNEKAERIDEHSSWLEGPGLGTRAS